MPNHLILMEKFSFLKRYILVVCSICCIAPLSTLSAQGMEITDAATPPITPANLITNIFLGDGVEVLDVTFEGDPLAVGYFKNAEPIVGIDRGILMTSGRAASVNCSTGPLGADCNGVQFSSNDNASTASDPDLAAIATGGIFDATKFTITFIPTSDTLRFKYVFASEEYPEWACTSFNDVFGFFISGPGITGPFSNNGKNIAQIPGTSIPVSINNIHPQNGGCAPAFAQYYNDNTSNNGQPVYDGYLSVFIAEAVVIPCSTYTIKLMVSDVGDPVFDTGVFLEAKSFGTGSLQVETSTVSLDGTITEDCASGSITFTFPGAVESDYPLDYTIIGTAVNGTDYLNIPLDLFIPQGDSTLSVDIVALEDFVDEGMETIGIDIQRDVCNRDTFWIFIRDNEIVPPNLGPDTSICQGDSLPLDGTLPIPLPVPPSFTNAQDYNVTHLGPTYSPIQVAGVQPITLEPGVIQSVCLNLTHKWVDDLDLFLISPGGQFIELSSDNGSNCDNYTNVCFTPTAGTSIGAGWPWSPCGSNIEASFANGTYQPEGVWSDLWDGDYPTNGTWQLLAIDDQAGFNGTILDWTITFEPLYQVYYEWTPTTGLSCADCPDPIASPNQTTTYHLSAWDTYGCMVEDSIEIEVKNVLPAPNINCSDVTNNSITFSWDDLAGASGYMVSIDGGPFFPNGTTSYLLTGLTLSDTVVIQVFGVSECDGEIGTVTCMTPACTAPSLAIASQTNLNCPGDTDGAITLQASGGAGNYTYTLGGNSNTTGVFSGLAAGTYPASVIDDWNCPNNISVTISAPNPLDIQAVIVNTVSCNGGTDAVATVEIDGGTYPFTFDWDSGQSDSLAVNLGVGTQTVTVTDANGCTATSSVDLTEPDLLFLNMAADSADCFATSTGAALVLIGGGTAPHIIQWDAAAGNATTDLVQNLAAGTYSVNVSDLNGCVATASVTVLEPAPITTSATPVDPFCNGSATGTAVATASGGVGGYQFFWSNGDLAITADSLTAGTYFVTVSDANSCTALDSVTLIDPPGMALTFTPTSVTCFGQNNGAITSVVNGGTLPYTYLWGNGSTTPNLSSIIAGNYCLTVTDGMGCTLVSCADVTQPAELLLSTALTNAGCNGGTSGEIDLTVAGGTSPHTFDWASGQTSEDLANLPAGTYTVEVTDGNGCTASISENISETDAIVIQLSQNSVNCFGGNDGSITTTVTGGSGNYNFDWSGPGPFGSTQQNPTGLVAGNFTVTVTDTDGCAGTQTIAVQQPTTAVAVSIAPPTVICFGANNGTATATASGGISPYIFLWANGQTSATATNLTAGPTAVTVTDANGCEVVGQVAIAQQDQLLVNLGQTASSCNNGTDGTAAITTATQGGNNVPLNTLTVLWSNGQSAPNVSGLTGGQTYSVMVTNSLGCTGTASIAIGNPSAVNAAIVSTENVKCAAGRDGTATVSVSGGTTPYTYLWDVNAESQITPTAIDLPAGVFNVTVTDANGCTGIAQATLTEPDALEVRFENENVKCHSDANGNSLAIPEGGVGPFSYLWSNGETQNKISDVTAGAYLLTVTDANGCSVETETEITQPGEPLLADFQVDYVTCFGLKDGRIGVNVAGGSPPYRFSLDGVNFNGNPTMIALPAGLYDVTVRDNNGCLFTQEDIYIGEPDPIVVNLGPDTIVRFGADLVLVPLIENLLNPATATYEWYSNNPQTQPVDSSARDAVFVVTSPTSVILTVTDENGCSAEDLINIFVREYRDIQVPTGFAPGTGGNILNDLLHVHGSSEMVEKINLFQVFDRWGELLYEGADFAINDPATGWDGNFKGKEMPAGVYVWYLEVLYVDGLTETYRGHTTLVR
ncbi:MAG: choice-of-anchor L domain-containing protein [Bacteroidetes bacterium]|nr:choice-of-anchor L domain-containing protein [Bacteroidota bacterium]